MESNCPRCNQTITLYRSPSVDGWKYCIHANPDGGRCEGSGAVYFPEKPTNAKCPHCGQLVGLMEPKDATGKLFFVAHYYGTARENCLGSYMLYDGGADGRIAVRVSMPELLVIAGALQLYHDLLDSGGRGANGYLQSANAIAGPPGVRLSSMNVLRLKSRIMEDANKK